MACVCLALAALPARAPAQEGPLVAVASRMMIYTPVAAEEVAPLLAMAVRLSRLPPLPRGSEPTVWSVTEAQLQSLVCQEAGVHCRGMQAAYDTDNNLILALEWGRQRGAEWESFVVHEFVHALQYAQRGEAIFDSCEASRATEQQAYDVQDAYLQQRGALLRVGSQMGWWQCPAEAAAVKKRLGAAAGTAPAGR